MLLNLMMSDEATYAQFAVVVFWLEGVHFKSLVYWSCQDEEIVMHLTIYLYINKFFAD